MRNILVLEKKKSFFIRLQINIINIKAHDLKCAEIEKFKKMKETQNHDFKKSTA